MLSDQRIIYDIYYLSLSLSCWLGVGERGVTVLNLLFVVDRTHETIVELIQLASLECHKGCTLPYHSN